MSENDNVDPSSETLAEEPSVSSADGEETVSNEANEAGATSPEEAKEQQDAITLDALNKYLKKDFKDVDTAMKSLKDTQSWVGKKVEDAQPSEKDEDNFVTREQFDTEMFFKDNPDHAANRELIEALASKHKVAVKDAVNLDVYKDVSEKISGFEESQKTKSVLHSNPRLGAVKDSLTEARELAQTAGKSRAAGDVVNAQQSQQQAEGKAVSAVIDAFDLDK
jgi:hypothetical protein